MNTAHIVTGSPASGKTTYGKELAKERGIPFIDIDTVTVRLVRVGMKEVGRPEYDRDSKYFKDTYREAIYETLFDIAKENLAWTDVVVVGPFTREIRDEEWPAKLRQRLDSDIMVYYTYCKPEVRVQRMKDRASPRDKLKFENWDEINASYGDESPPPFEHTFIDNS